MNLPIIRKNRDKDTDMSETAHIKVEVEERGTVPITRGTSLLELRNIAGITEQELIPVVGALYNGRVMGLEYCIGRKCRVRFITTGTDEGADIYRRSLSMLLHAAFLDVMGETATLKIEHSLSRGFYYTYKNSEELTDNAVRRIERRMQEMTEKCITFTKKEHEIEHALDIFENIHAHERLYLLKYMTRAKITLYTLGRCVNLAQGPLVPHTGYLKLFRLISYSPGLILVFPTVDKPGELPPFLEQKKLFQIYSEQREWSRLLDVDSAGKLNRTIIKGKIDNLIWLSEGLHEKKIANIADSITKRASSSRVIFLAGPSSSGKTTFAKRLMIQLLANGIGTEIISLDNYYLPRNRMPKNKKGETNFDNLHALDLDLIKKHIQSLLDGRSIEIPKYDFKTGMREDETTPLRLNKNQVVIIEGIHCMNRALTGMICESDSYKIYISALTQLNLDVINRIPTSTVRLIRRIVRDSEFRAYSASQTISKWHLVPQGEEQNIFPHQEEADVMFNSSLVYEMSVLKGYIEPVLLDIEESDPSYTKARLLLHFTSNFLSILPEHVPLTSILREFIGGSGFKY